MITYFVPNIYPCTIGGLEIFYFYLINATKKHTKLCLATSCRTNKFKQVDRIKIIGRLFLIRRYGFSKLSIIISSLIKLILYRKKITVFHIPCTSQTGYYGYIFPFLKKLFSLKYIICFHGGGMKKWRRFDGNKKLFKNADRIIAVSEIIKKEYERRSNRKIDVILPLVPFTYCNNTKEQLKQKYGFDKNSRIVIMVGSIKLLKGNLYVYNEFKNLKDEFKQEHHLKLLFVGDGPDRYKLENNIKYDGLESTVKIINNIPNEHICEIYKIADYYVIASDFEGTSESLLEAMFNSLPIIATNVKGINNIIKHKNNGILIDKKKSVSFVEAVMELVSNKELSKNLGNKAKEDYNQFYNFERTLSDFENIYKSYIKT